MSIDGFQAPLDPCNGKISPKQLAISEKEVHIWIVSLELSATFLEELSKSLNQDERKRADGFVFERDRIRFIARRSILREIIGSYYLGIPPSLVEFKYGRRGKPFLSSNSAKHYLQFNLSDSHNIAIFAFSMDFELGIDIEYMRHIPDASEIIASVCSNHEIKTFMGVRERFKQEAFFNCWTRKEAFIKLIGEGLFFPLDKFDVALTPGAPARLLNVEGRPDEAHLFSMHSFTPMAGYKAAVMVKGTPRNYKYFIDV